VTADGWLAASAGFEVGELDRGVRLDVGLTLGLVEPPEPPKEGSGGPNPSRCSP
jgi:hypothetical protein